MSAKDRFARLIGLSNSKSIKNLAYKTDGMYAYNNDVGLLNWRYWAAYMDYPYADTTLKNVIFIGDSIFEGNNMLEDTIANRLRAIVPMFRNMANARWGNVGEGFIYAQYPAGATVKRWTYAGTWSSTSVEGWAQSIYCKTRTDTASSTATLTFNGTGIVVLFQGSDTNPSTADITVDGVAKPSASVYNAGAAVIASTIAGLSDGEHTLVITHAAGRVTLLGAYETTTVTKGIRVNNISAAGLKAGDFSFYTEQMLASIDYWEPVLTVLSPLANDFLAATPIATYKAAMQTLITRAKAFGDVLLLTIGAMFDTIEASTIPASEYVNALYELARENDVALLDIAAAWGDTYTASHAAGYIGDGHPTTKGHQSAANMLYDLLIPQSMYAQLEAIKSDVADAVAGTVDATARASIADITNDAQIQGFVVCTAAEYAALGTPDSDTVYLITG